MSMLITILYRFTNNFPEISCDCFDVSNVLPKNNFISRIDMLSIFKIISIT